MRRNSLPPYFWAILLAAVLFAAGIPTALLLHRGSGAGASAGHLANVRANSDLLALKSEAEALAIEGKLAEAHAKYRQLQGLAATRDIKDPLLWDILERAKVDQDHIYTILLAKAQFELLPPGADGPMLPSRAVFPPSGLNPPTTNSMLAILPDQPPDLATSRPLQPAPGPATQAIRDSERKSPRVMPTTAPATDESAEDGNPLDKPAGNPLDKTPAATRSAFGPRPTDPQALTDEQIGQSLQRGVDFLIAHFRDGQIPGDTVSSQQWREGLDALCVFALAQASQAIKDDRLNVKGPFMKDLLEKLKNAAMDSDLNGTWQPVTYARSLRAAALAVYNRPEDKIALNEDAAWLVTAEILGAYTYDDRFGQFPGRFGDAPQPPADSPKQPEHSYGQPPFRRDPVSSGAVPEQLHPHGGSSGGAGVPPGARVPPGAEGGGWIGFIPNPVNKTPNPPGPPGPNRPPPRVLMHNGEPIPPRMPPSVPPRSFPPPGYSRKAGDRTAEPERKMTADDVPWDNSNSQYGVLGVWSCAECGIEIPGWYWKDVEKHWVTWQLKDGQWGYKKTDNLGSLAMTAAGIASLFVTADWNEPSQARISNGREPFSKSLAAGLKWLEQGDHCLEIAGAKSHYRGYDLFSLERVGLASGFKHFGQHDWYRELAAEVVRRQWPDGSWGPSGSDAQSEKDKLIETAYHVLFLARGRHPILMNKLRFDGLWANHPRDAANLARYASRVLERGVNWQAVSVGREWTEWLDSPVLYIASTVPPKWTNAEYDKLRKFVQAGGLIFTHADLASETFNKWVPDLAKTLWPDYELQPLADDHEIYSVHAKLRQPHMKLAGVSNGSRLLLLHAPGDLGHSWHMRAERSHPEAFELGLNVFLYASGKADMRNRLASPWIAALPDAPPPRTIKLARLKYAGNWDPEPGAWTRFSRYLQLKTKTTSDCLDVNIADLKPGVAPLAHLTGTAAYTATDAEINALREYVAAGGVLLIDACGGNGAFAGSIEKDLLTRAFPSAKVERLSPDAPPMKAALPGMVDATKPSLRPYALARAGGQIEPHGFRILHHAKGVVIFSPLDLTTGILGANTWGIFGYAPEYAQDFVRNVLLWSAAER